MKMRMSLLVACVAALLAVPVAGADSGVKYYLALGDSLAQGYQPIGGPWSPLGFPGYNQGYPDQLLKLIRQPNEQPRLIKLACGGETTTTMIEGSPWCGANFPAGSQLAEAKAFLQAHQGDVALVTIDIGGNDVADCAATMDDACFAKALDVVQQQLPEILGSLRDSAGPGVPIVGMTYYDPFLAAAWFATHDLSVLQGAVDFVVAVNNVLAGAYASAADPVADVEGAFATTDVADADGNGVPDDVDNVCAWTWMCVSPPHGPDIHPNDAGYGVIAQAFEDVLKP